jgi:putative spermidine/putrescine transport system substrate-binding protein
MKPRTYKPGGAMALAAALAVGSVGCGGDDADEATTDSSPAAASSSTAEAAAALGGSVTYTGWGGTDQEKITEAWLDPFAAEFGIKVEQDTPPSATKMSQMVDAGEVIWDVVQFGPEFGVVDNPRLEYLDCEIISCDDYGEDSLFPIYPQAIPLWANASVLAYNTDMVPSLDGTRAEAFFDVEKYPGKRAVWNVTGEMFMGLEEALLADGVAPDDLYPLDVERALAKLDTIKDELIVYADDGECVNLVASGEAVFGQCYMGRVKLAQDEGQPIDWVWSQQRLLPGYLMVPKGAPNVDNAMRLIAYMTSAENNGRASAIHAIGAANPRVVVEPEWAENSPTANVMDGVDAPVLWHDDFWSAHRDEVVERVSEWLST